MSKFVGIDISKDHFDAAWADEKTGKMEHRKLTNDAKGWHEFKKELRAGDRLVMEASGVYYLMLAVFFQQKGFSVSVVNPLVIKRFAQMQNVKAKTDKKDAQVIAQYAERMADQLKNWQLSPDHVVQMNAIQTALDLLAKQRTAAQNQLKTLKKLPVDVKDVEKALENVLKTLDKEAKKLEEKLDELAKTHFSEQLAAIQSIPGIGKSTSRRILVETNGLEGFESAKQLASFFGICPSPHQSGTSVRGKGHISKRGSPSMRKALYVCSWSAISANPNCKALYERLIQNGTASKVALVAVAHKLLRIAFGVAKSLVHFEKNFHLKTAF